MCVLLCFLRSLFVVKIFPQFFSEQLNVLPRTTTTYYSSSKKANTVVTCVDSSMGIKPVQRVEGGETLEIFADEGSLLSVDPDVDLEGV